MRDCLSVRAGVISGAGRAAQRQLRFMLIRSAGNSGHEPTRVSGEVAAVLRPSTAQSTQGTQAAVLLCAAERELLPKCLHRNAGTLQRVADGSSRVDGVRRVAVQAERGGVDLKVGVVRSVDPLLRTMRTARRATRSGSHACLTASMMRPPPGSYSRSETLRQRAGRHALDRVGTSDPAC